MYRTRCRTGWAFGPRRACRAAPAGRRSHKRSYGPRRPRPGPRRWPIPSKCCEQQVAHRPTPLSARVYALIRGLPCDPVHKMIEAGRLRVSDGMEEAGQWPSPVSASRHKQPIASCHKRSDGENATSDLRRPTRCVRSRRRAMRSAGKCRPVSAAGHGRWLKSRRGRPCKNESCAPAAVARGGDMIEWPLCHAPIRVELPCRLQNCRPAAVDHPVGAPGIPAIEVDPQLRLRCVINPFSNNVADESRKTGASTTAKSSGSCRTTAALPDRRNPSAKWT